MTAQSMTAQPVTAQPVTAHRYRSLRPMTRVLSAIFTIYGLYALISIGIGWQWLDVLAGSPGANERLMATADAVAIPWYVDFALLAAGVVGFCVWAYRANQNARTLGAGHMRFTPAATVVWFFVPFLCLWRPYQAIRETWQASNPEVEIDAEPEAGTHWKTPMCPVPGFFIVWWLSWVMSRQLEWISSQMMSATSPIVNEITAIHVSMAASALKLVAVVLVIVMMQSMVNRQEARATRRSLPSARVQA